MVDRVTYYYTIHPGSVMTSTAQQRRVRSFRTVIREMYRYGVEHGLRNRVDFHHRLEQYRLNLMRMLLADKPLFDETYRSVRQDVPKPWKECFHLDGMRLNKQVRDFHLALPVKSGAAWMRGWFKVETLLKGL